MSSPFLGRTFLIGAGIIVFANAVALGGVALNRRGQPESELKLSQRELRTTWTEEENSGLAVQLDVRMPANPHPDTSTLAGKSNRFRVTGSFAPHPYWFDSTKLRELGYPMPADLSSAPARQRANHGLEREAYFVVEFDGPAYQRALADARADVKRADSVLAAKPKDGDAQGRAKYAGQALRREEQENSRLFLIDAGRDIAALRARYPDRARFAILRGRYGANVAVGGDHPGGVYGEYRDLEIDAIDVPKRFRDVMTVLTRPGGESSPLRAVTVTIAFGSRLEPWVVAATR